MALASKSYSLSNNAGSVNLVWPANLVDSYDYLQIDISEFVPRARGNSPSVSSSSSSTPAPTSSSTQFSFGLFGVSFGGSIGSTTSTSLQKQNTILLPIPEDLNYTDNPQWTETAVGVKGRYGADLIKDIADVMGKQEGSVEGVVNTIKDTAGAGKVSILLDMIRKAGADPNAITQNINGKIANPYLEQVFGGIGMREFTFNWKLVPRNEKEQQSIHHIIKTLRKSTLPNLNDKYGKIAGNNTTLDVDEKSEGSDRWLTVPKVFNLHWKSQGVDIESLPKIKTCVCKNVQVSYTPDNVWATHLTTGDNPYPVGYNLSLTFGETEIITSTDVEQGY